MKSYTIVTTTEALLERTYTIEAESEGQAIQFMKERKVSPTEKIETNPYGEEEIQFVGEIQ